MFDVDYNLYGGKEIGVLLKMWSLLNWKHPSLVLFMSGLLFKVSQIVTVHYFIESIHM